MSQPAALSTDSRLLEQGDPLSDGRAFRRCLGQYPTGVSVITAQHGDKRVGMAANSFAAVSLDPALVLWSVRCESSSAATFMAASHFAISVLAADQVEVSQLFGSGHEERFNRVPWTAGAGNAPLIDGAIAHLQCRLVKVYEGGDHWILLGQVEHYARFAGEPLVFAQGQYAVTQNHPQLADNQASQNSPAGDGDGLFTSLLNSATQHMSRLFHAHRQELGVTAASARLVNILALGAASLDAIEHESLLGRGAIEDALNELSKQGLVQSNAGEYALTEAGLLLRQALIARATEFTAQQLAGIPEADLAAAKRVLRKLLSN
ncbi:flavin reductase [Pseudomonas sp. 5P_3.1_Bac2]|uniref:flavin reductase n=1 Tax=Pseudomonas sp. 5P_3.1_Bac2 TaxID=2971617 RepID=UPI0021C9DB76|nr:flavin reductase [Pseudomonas sp. 5P_3.1_Bac2]MCU1719514.1 flavin reductase [Pseudomonas sp. 5P_3.1_Bac2]